MGSVFLAGDRFNAAAYGTVTASPAADVNYPLSKLIDLFLDEFWFQGSIAADSYIQCDLNQVVNPGFETFSGSFTGWTSGTVGGGSTVTQDGAIKKAGSFSAKLTVGAAGGSKAEVLQLITVRSGQKWRGSFSMYAGAGGVTKAEVYNPYTKMYLASSGAWQTAQTYYKTTAGTVAWEDFTASLTVESWVLCQASLTILQLRFVAETVSTVGYVDEVYFWPEVNAAVLIGHNVEPGLPIQWRSSTDNFAANDVLVATLPARAGVTYSYQSTAVVTRWVRLKFVGTPVAKLRATEVVWGYALATSETPSWGYRVRRSIPQIRSSRDSVRWADFSLDAVTLRFQPAYSTQWAEIETEIFERCSSGQPIIAVPDTNRLPIFIGRTPIEWSYQATSLAIIDTELPIEPLPIGIWAP